MVTDYCEEEGYTFGKQAYGYLRMVVHKTIGQELTSGVTDSESESERAQVCRYIYITIFTSFGGDEFADVYCDIDRRIDITK